MFLHNSRNGLFRLLLAAGALTVCASWAKAKSHSHSPFLTGPLGLNTVPSARMDEPGTIRTGISTLAPYIHTHIGLQIAEPLYINLRQTAEISNLWESADRLDPGLDFKLRLARERPYTPEVSIGVQSALGDKRMAGEYLAVSKRLDDFDLTAGLGWGRYGSAGHIPNPLRVFGGHFSGNRNLDGETNNAPYDWFTGDEIGIFGGVEYFTPVDGLSLKFDFGADEYIAEQSAFGYANASPWSLGFSYSPAEWMSAGMALQGGEKIMGRVSLQANPASWPLRDRGKEPPAPSYSLMKPPTENLASAVLNLSETSTTPAQVGNATRALLSEPGENVQAVQFRLISLGLRGPSVRLLRKDFENATGPERQGSPQEIWSNTEFNAAFSADEPKNEIRQNPRITLSQQNKLSLAEDDTGLLFRSSLLAHAQAPELLGIMTVGGAFRLNIADNLAQLEYTRQPSLFPVRGDEGLFAARTLSLDSLYVTAPHSFTPEIHAALTAGYLEEMYAGIGGEFIVRPFRSRFVLGAELWETYKRDPLTALNLGLTGEIGLTGHINAWYDWPGQDVTLFTRAGRFLGGDYGVTGGLEKDFENGAQLKGFLTLTNDSDSDLHGNRAQAFHGVSLSLPLGSAPYIPDGSTLDVSANPLARNAGQNLEKPVSLYDLTKPFAFDHMARNWNDIIGN